ncbi:hypothetical protein [Streptomyces sp. NPDC047985]
MVAKNRLACQAAAVRMISTPPEAPAEESRRMIVKPRAPGVARLYGV